MPPGLLKIKDNSYLTDVLPLRHVNLHCETLSTKTATLLIQNTCRVKNCYVAAAATYMSAGLVLLPQTPLLLKLAF